MKSFTYETLLMIQFITIFNNILHILFRVCIVMENYIFKFRKEQQMSLDKLSRLSHISKAQISKIERGESDPTLISAYKISRALKKSVYEVFPER